MNTDRWLTFSPITYEDAFVSRDEHRAFVQAVQAEAMDFGLQYRIEAPNRTLEEIDRLEREQRRKPILERQVIAHVWCGYFQVFYGTWRTVAREHEPMTPQTRWQIDPAEWFKIKAEAARDITA